MSIMPRVFIASSLEGRNVAYEIQALLDHDAECTVWDQDVFNPSSTTMTDLIAIARETDYGVFVFSFEDDVKIRGEEKLATRDNVLLEFGLFSGIIGISNCYIVMPKNSSKFHFASDIVGLTPLMYNAERHDKNLKAALGPAAHQILRKMNSTGLTHRLSSQLIQQLHNTGLSAFYATRDDYAQYRTGASSIDKYLNTAQKSIVIVGISLSTGIHFDNICKCIEERLCQSSDFKVTVSLLNPKKSELYQSICDVFNCDYQELQSQTKRTLKRLLRIRAKLVSGTRERFIIKVHNTIPFASAIMLDDELEDGKIQIETKPYKVGMRESFALEFRNNGNGFYETLRSSYYGLINDGEIIERV